MLFNSYEFILAFLPIVVIIYYALNYVKKNYSAKWWIIGASLFFYGYFNLSYLGILILSILINYGLHRLLKKNRVHFTHKSILAVGIILNLATLVYFKYMDFFIENINFLFWSEIPLLNIVLPLGISFFTFQQISFLIDTYRGQTEVYSFVDYSFFVSFFPQLVAGPIVLHKEIIGQIKDEARHRVDYEYIIKGICYFVIGLSKKILIADTLGHVVDWGFDWPSRMNTVSGVIVIISYTLQIYFDFSGYSDMAIGLGKLFHIDLPINFNSPYKATTIADFWKRWHITMTRFFTEYLYIPLGGNKKGLIRTCINTLIVFGLSGLWHGANWNFVIWGLLHGIALVIYRLGKKGFERVPQIIQWVTTLGFVSCCWVFFRAESFTQALSVFYHTLFGGPGGPDEFIRKTFVSDFWELVFGRYELFGSFQSIILPLGVWGALFIAIFMVLKCKNTTELIAPQKLISFRQIISISILFLLCVLSLSEVSSFLYFNF